MLITLRKEGLVSPAQPRSYAPFRGGEAVRLGPPPPPREEAFSFSPMFRLYTHHVAMLATLRRPLLLLVQDIAGAAPHYIRENSSASMARKSAEFECRAAPGAIKRESLQDHAYQVISVVFYRRKLRRRVVKEGAGSRRVDSRPGGHAAPVRQSW